MKAGLIVLWAALALAMNLWGLRYYERHRDVAAMAIIFGDTHDILFFKGDGSVDRHPMADEGSALQKEDLDRLTRIPASSKIGIWGQCPKTNSHGMQTGGM